MANEIVKYNNDFNQVGLRNFNSVELDILMAIMSRMRDKGLEEICFSFDYLKKLTKWKDNTASSFPKTLETVYDKLLSIKFKIGDNRNYTKFVLFTKYTVDSDNQDIVIGVNKEFQWVLNELAKNFTRFELEEFVDFKSSYTKEFFRRMKQFRNSGFWDVSLEDFKLQLNIPDNYRITDIDTWVLKPIMNELKNKYHLKVTKKYNKKGKGRPAVIGFKFTFSKEIVELNGVNETGEKVYETNKNLNQEYYKNRTIILKDKKFNQKNFLKILGIYEEIDGTIKVKVKNVDDEYINTLTFENLVKWENFFKKYVI